VGVGIFLTIKSSNRLKEVELAPWERAAHSMRSLVVLRLRSAATMSDGSMSLIFSEYLPWLIFPLCLGAIAYYGYAIYAAKDFFAQPRNINLNFHPPITVLKPLCGLDLDAYENLASFCNQDYPCYQVIFVVREENDPSLTIVWQLMQEYRDRDISLVVNPGTIGTNLKVSNLANAIKEAKYEIVAIADSDIQVGPDYLQQVVQPLSDETVGVVTCLYNSKAKGLIANFEALATSCEFHPSVLVARKLEGIEFAFGSTIVTRQKVLDAIGGFEAIADCLADDFQLGKLPTTKGYKVVLSSYIVQHLLATESFFDLLSRQIRWARCVRVERFWSYLGLLFTHATVTSLLFLFFTLGSKLGWTVLGITWSLRLIAAHSIAIRYLKDPVTQKFFWLIPLRDLVSFVIWCCGLIGDQIEWRGKKFKLIKGGKLIEI
jgi:ceramide glucosyltransferase